MSAMAEYSAAVTGRRRSFRLLLTLTIPAYAYVALALLGGASRRPLPLPWQLPAGLAGLGLISLQIVWVVVTAAVYHKGCLRARRMATDPHDRHTLDLAVRASAVTVVKVVYLLLAAVTADLTAALTFSLRR